MTGASDGLVEGLALRRDSVFAGGDRERRSNREARFGSGSVWSKRERFAVRLSVSSMVSRVVESCSVCLW